MSVIDMSTRLRLEHVDTLVEVHSHLRHEDEDQGAQDADDKEQAHYYHHDFVARFLHPSIAQVLRLALLLLKFS